MRIKHFSDTHEHHKSINPENFNKEEADVIIFSGDAANTRSAYMNLNPMLDHIEWYEKVPCKYKIFVAGNHDTSIEARLVVWSTFANKGIIYLENSFTRINDLIFYGSPYTPTFGDWSFMKARHKIHEIWDKAPSKVDVLITHGPPFGVRDLTYERDGSLVMVGDKSLKKYIDKVKPKLHCFGHVHNNKDIINQGISIQDGVIYSNGACVDDGKFDRGLTSFGNIINL